MRVKLGDVADIKNGATPSSQIAAYWNGAIPWCTPTDVTRTVGKYLIETERRITEQGLASCGASLLPTGALLLCSRATIGEVKIATFPVCANQGFKALVCKEDVYHEFLYYLLALLKPQLIKRATGSTFLEISKCDLSSIELDIPPYHEQRVVAEVLSDVDRMLGALEFLIAKKSAIRLASMQQLLTGKVRLAGHSGEWIMKRLGDIGSCMRGVSYDPLTDVSNHDKDTTVRLLRSNNVQGAAVFSGDVQYVNCNRVADTQIMRQNDILICMANGSKELVGKSGLFTLSDGNLYTFGAFMGCFRTALSGYDPRFVFYLLQTSAFRDYLGQTLAGSSINNLRPVDIETAMFRFPDRHEQAAIVAVLSDMDAEISALEARRDKMLAIKQGMMQQLLTGRVRLVKSVP